MRLGVLDVGSNTVHLIVVDAHRGARPVPESSEKRVLRLMRYLQPDGSISDEGVEVIMRTMHEAAELIESASLDELLPLATSALREAKNGPELLERIRTEAGIDLHVMTGAGEARTTFLAVRRWFGWAAGRIMLVDIGGGSLELASGRDEMPDVALSIPLGAGRTTMEFLKHDPPLEDELDRLRAHARKLTREAAKEFNGSKRADQYVGSSKTIRSLARLAGSVVDGIGPNDRVTLRRWQLDDWVPRLARLTADARPALPGITADRTFQIVAGGVVLCEVMDAFDIAELDVSPWAMREGVLLDYLDTM
ncbi:Ppx/GppA family phosphatase [Pseudoclavibacter chungangensis]|uniref:Ppx/GppA family phosphatase n=1 Tax=Pseudoclavibacter chungangensis TaxID=587635 RepID=A0A7J5BPU6_9MICO|nr:Ppx/GppA phosphatase family protein [Pseudoclavibacter chungangensis]KAB1652979.1 Ppx/GppA family phosphatase [Pseudoclavibacter chungangensis]NYJ65221.1 exopolyphosphatase/guanosine-5'-triphosphate,3'-diphosphate pyrophosphatase [Pseudoclavibacter chungangensis]